jgi:hypothetical protein
MPTTVKTITGREKRNSASKSEINYKKYKEKTSKKSSYFIKRRKTLTQHQHGRFMQNFESLKDKSKPKLNEKTINTSQSNSDTRHSNPDSCLIGRQQADHSGQLSLKLENLTVQAANRRENCVLLFSLLQKNVVAPQIQHISLQMLDAGLKVHLPVLKPRLLQQRLLVF